ncbi:PaaI family thioesterase [Streptosporangium sp. NPDC023825]|uniref:PaaI family thioesterase n=1 Tax=Streptosporangium sp. NPDC023825 TaxID=3154909 RepID=UPI00344AEF8A
MSRAAGAREHVISWEDPGVLAREGLSMSGLDCMNALIEGKLPPPPACSLMNFRLTEVAEGHAIGVMKPAEYHYNPFGGVHGGVLVTLMDTVMGCAVHTMLAAGVLYSTLEVKSNFVRQVSVHSGTLRCLASVIHLGGRTATAECRVTDASGDLCAHATTTCLILRPPNSGNQR